ncbi:MAG: efflux transporter outer membrane subunit [Sulfuricella denitrificans]|nr:efflux transporter outer membrane subunit [Sulfuricella denitrificans]
MRDHRSALLSAMLSVLLLSACAIGPDYVRPSAPEKTATPFVSGGEVASAVSLPEEWWRLYQDPVLDQLVQRAFAANVDLRIAAANLERERAVLSEADIARFPSTQISAGRTYGDSTSSSGQGSTLPDRQRTTTGGLTVSWEVDLLGRVRRSVEAAHADVEAVEATRDAVRVTVAAETTRNYVAACSLAESLVATEQSIAITRQTLDLMQQQERVGSASRFDVERATVTLANTEAGLPSLQARRQNALFALAALLGATPSEVPAEAAACAKAPALSAPIPVADGAALLRRRPDLRQAERKLAGDTARIGVATADLYPRISLGGSTNYARSGGSGGDWTFGVGPALSWSFPNIGVARAKVKQSEAQVQASLASFDGSVLSALREVEQTLTTLNAEQRRRVSLEQADRSARVAYDLAEARYRAGSISQIERLAAAQDRVAAQSTLAESEVSLNAARVDVFKALGGGWQATAGDQ